MKTHSLQFKVLLIVAGAMAIAAAVAIACLYKVYGSIQELDRVSREDFQSQQAILRAHGSFRLQVQEWKSVLLRGREPGTLQRHWELFESHEREAGALMREARSATPHDNVRNLLDAALAMHRTAGRQYRDALQAFKASNMDAHAGDQAALDVHTMTTHTLVEAEEKALELGQKAVLAAVGAADTVYRLAVAAIALAILLALAILWAYLRRSVLDPIGAAMRFADRIAEGDLTAVIRSSSRDELGQLLDALARMNESLSRVVTQVRASSESVVAASGQVSAGTTDLSQRTEEQASSLEETAASMEELASTVRQNAENARMADELARGASLRAEQGGDEVGNVVSTMSEISASAKRIADIISVIDGIAFQTNILALNAAVEAARAGEQGRGFAVVAAEVRSLAQRSAQAAKEIKDLIGNSVARVDAGTKLVEQAGYTIQTLVVDVKRVSTLMGQIAEASSEQSRGVQQVNKTVTEMDKVVQQNAAAVQQSASAAASMRLNAESLARAVSAFRLTVEERIDMPALPQPQAALAEPPAQAPVARRAPEKARRADAVPAGADDWEEF